MARNLVLVRHRETDELMYMFSKKDLSKVLGVSTRTISRLYSNAGIYQSVDYTIYICDKRYSDGEDKNYNRNVKPPKLGKKETKSIVNADKEDKMSSIDQIVGHRHNIHISIPVNGSPLLSELEDNLSYNDEEEGQEEQDWRKVEDNLSITEYDTYYSKRTYEQLSQSKLRYDNVRGQSPRLKIINKYGELKAND